VIARTKTIPEAAPADASVAQAALVVPATPMDPIAAAEAVYGPRPEDPVERLAWYAGEGRGHLPYEPQSLLAVAITELARHLRVSDARVLTLAAELDQVRSVLPSRARSLSPATIAEMRQADPYAELEVLEDWAIGTARLTRGAVVRLDHYPRLEDSVRAGLLVGSHRQSLEEAEAVAAAVGAAASRRAELAELEAQQAAVQAATARARAESLRAETAVAPAPSAG
jgi:hypothetical protein